MKRSVISTLVICALVAMASPARAEYPERIVKIVSGAPPGGGLDILVRGVAQELTVKWGKSVIVENRAGASGMIAASAVAGSAPDGYTLLAVTDQTYLANRFMFKNLPYDPDAFANISLIALANQIILVNAEIPVKTLSELMALEKQKPGSLAYGSWGDGSTPQLVYETLNKGSGSAFLNVPYKGVAPVLVALTTNEVQMSVISGGTAAGLLSSGKVRPLAIAAKSRAPEFPDLPTTAEAGFPQLRASIWFGITAPPGTPKALVEKISADVREIANRPAFVERFVTAQGWKLVASTPAEMDAAIQAELPVIREMVANTGVQPQ